MVGVHDHDHNSDRHVHEHGHDEEGKCVGKWRFTTHDRVLCNTGDDETPLWEPGTVQMVGVPHDHDHDHEHGHDDEACRNELPYLVKLDPSDHDPRGRLIHVKHDTSAHCLAEVCFGKRASALYYTLYCRPRGEAWRFAAGDRVAVAVEDRTGDFSVWAAGTVLSTSVDVERHVENTRQEASACLPSSTLPGPRSISGRPQGPGSVQAGRPTELMSSHLGGVRREGAPPRLGLGRCLPGAIQGGAGLWLPCPGAPGGALARARPGVAGGGSAPGGRRNALREADRRAAEWRPSGADRSRHAKGARC
jgi:hypothetical protein